ncbi:MAG: sporulation inhibitor of replication protein SirA [Bacilli bacterium]|nr:sporulation inhibitor of replication protein SirA [Bacilli bacterium]
MRVYFIFQIKEEFRKLYEGRESKLFSILKSIYRLSMDEVEYGYTLLNQVTSCIDQDLINRDLYVHLHREAPYSYKNGIHYYNQLYKNEVSRLVVKHHFMKIEVDQEKSSFFPELESFHKNLFVCDFHTSNFFYIS